MNTFIRGLTLTFKGVATAVKFIFIKLWLWVPAVFALGYLIVCAAFDFEVRGEEGLTVLLTGSIILAAAALLFAGYFYMRKARRPKADKPTVRYAGLKVERKKRGEDERDYDRDYDRESSFKIEPKKTRMEEPFYKKEPISCNPPSDYDEPLPKRDFVSDMRSGEVQGARRLVLAEEKPLVFKSRQDPEILIAEYSDRLVMYRTRRDGGEPTYIDTEYKK